MFIDLDAAIADDLPEEEKMAALHHKAMQVSDWQDIWLPCWVIPKKCYKLTPCLAHRHKEKSLAVQPDCVKGRYCLELSMGIRTKTIWYKSQESRNCISSLNFYLVLHGLLC